MRIPRIKIPTCDSEAAYHCISRTVNYDRLFDDTDKKAMRRILWKVAAFCGVKIITYTILSSHFHILVRIPRKAPISDEELLRRYQILHPSPQAVARLTTIAAWLRDGAPEGIAWRTRMLRLMGELSAFMKLFKQRVSIWFNRVHNRHGPLWSDRFKSLLCEPCGAPICALALYIDLNSIRAGLAQDPKDYRFSGYAEAVAGNPLAQCGIEDACSEFNWPDAQRMYRVLLFGKGSAPKMGKASIDSTKFQEVLQQGGMLTIASQLRCRIRYLTEGAILGSRAFVLSSLTSLLPAAEAARRTRIGTPPLPKLFDTDSLTLMKGVRDLALG